MPALPWHHRWNILALTVLTQALVIGVQAYSFAFWVVPWVDEFHEPRSRIMLAITGSTVIMSLVSPLAGMLCDRYSLRRLFCIGTLIVSISFAVMSVAQSYWIILLVYACLLPLGVVLNGNLICQIIVARWFKSQRGFAFGISALGVSLGAFMMPPIATGLIGEYGWRTTFVILAGVILLVIGAMGWWALGRQNEKEEVDPAALASHPSMTTPEILKNTDFWILAGCFFAIIVGALPIMFTLGDFAHDLGFSQRQAAIAASTGAVVLAIGKVGFGWLCDRLSIARTYRLAAVLMILGIGVLTTATSLIQFTVGLCLTCLGQACTLPLSSSMAMRAFGAHAFARVAGLAWLFIGMGSVSSYFVGWLRDSGAGYASAYAIMAIPLVLAAVAVGWFARKPVAA